MTLNEVVRHVVMEQACRNVYVDLDGTIHPTKRDMGVDGLWYFDGQIFYIKDITV